MGDFTSDHPTILGARIHVRRAGEGPPLLFLHGAGGVPVWLPFYARLAETFELIVPDHPGFGESDTPPWLRGIDDAAMFYLDFLDALGLGSVHVVGASLGGWIAAEAAVRRGDPFRTLTLIGPAGLRVKGVPSGDNFIWSPADHAQNLFYDQALAQRMLDAPVTPELEDLQIKNRFATARLAWEPRFFSLSLERWLHRIKAPVLLIWGDSDKVMPPDYARAWQAGLADSRLVTVEQSGHLPQVEHPDRVAAEIRRFVEGAGR